MNMGEGCDTAFAGDSPMDIAEACSKHFMESTDDAHREGREMMAGPPNQEGQKVWWDWFMSEWENRADINTPGHA